MADRTISGEQRDGGTEFRLGSIEDIEARLKAMPDGVVHGLDPHPHWWAKSGHHQWTVHFVPGMIEQRLPMWAELAQRQVLVVDEECWAKRGDEHAAYLDHFGVERKRIEVPAGEGAKDPEVVHMIWRRLGELGVGPNDLVMADGGGACADAMRMATASWGRGTRNGINALSSLCAIDAAVGTKYFVDLALDDGRRLKNPVGGYRPAKVVLADPTQWTTVPEQHNRSCTAEILKLMIKDRRIISLLESVGVEMQKTGWSDPGALETIVLAADIMIREIQANPEDKIKARLMDHGHFVGKIIELLAKPPMPHGFSVAICMAVTLVVAARRGYIDWSEAHRILELMHRLKLPIWHPLLTADVFGRAIQAVVKQRDNKQNVPLLHNELGAVFAQNLRVAELVEAADYTRLWQPGMPVPV